MFSNFLTETTAAVLNVVTTVGVPVLTAMALNYARTRWKLNISDQREKALTGLAQQACMTASQTLTESDNPKKKASAVRQLQRKAKSLGVALAEDAATELVEAGVNHLKRSRLARLIP